jgi:hypothetical protein
MGSAKNILPLFDTTRKRPVWSVYICPASTVLSGMCDVCLLVHGSAYDSKLIVQP